MCEFGVNIKQLNHDNPHPTAVINLILQRRLPPWCSSPPEASDRETSCAERQMILLKPAKCSAIIATAIPNCTFETSFSVFLFGITSHNQLELPVRWLAGWLRWNVAIPFQTNMCQTVQDASRVHNFSILMIALRDRDFNHSKMHI